MGLSHEEKTQCLDAARTRVPKRHQAPSMHDSVSNSERLNRMEAWAIEKLGYDEEEAAKILAAQDKAFLGKAVAEEEKRILEQKRLYSEFSDASFKIFMDVFAPFAFTERLKWDSQLTDDATGERSPSLETILREQLPAIADPLALSNPEEFRTQIIEKYSEFGFDWEFDRFKHRNWKNEHPFERYFRVVVKFKVVRR